MPSLCLLTEWVRFLCLLGTTTNLFDIALAFGEVICLLFTQMLVLQNNLLKLWNAAK